MKCQGAGWAEVSRTPKICARVVLSTMLAAGLGLGLCPVSPAYPWVRRGGGGDTYYLHALSGEVALEVSAATVADADALREAAEEAAARAKRRGLVSTLSKLATGLDALAAAYAAAPPGTADATALHLALAGAGALFDAAAVEKEHESESHVAVGLSQLLDVLVGCWAAARRLPVPTVGLLAAVLTRGVLAAQARASEPSCSEHALGALLSHDWSHRGFARAVGGVLRALRALQRDASVAAAATGCSGTPTALTESASSSEPHKALHLNSSISSALEAERGVAVSDLARAHLRLLLLLVDEAGPAVLARQAQQSEEAGGVVEDRVPDDSIDHDLIDWRHVLGVLRSCVARLGCAPELVAVTAAVHALCTLHGYGARRCGDGDSSSSGQLPEVLSAMDAAVRLRSPSASTDALAAADDSVVGERDAEESGVVGVARPRTLSAPALPPLSPVLVSLVVAPPSTALFVPGPWTTGLYRPSSLPSAAHTPSIRTSNDYSSSSGTGGDPLALRLDSVRPLLLGLLAASLRAAVGPAPSASVSTAPHFFNSDLRVLVEAGARELRVAAVENDGDPTLPLLALWVAVLSALTAGEPPLVSWGRGCVRV